MGEAKRRKLLDLNYGKATWLHNPPLLKKPYDSAFKTAAKLVDCDLAVHLFLDFDSERVVPLPKEESILPEDWPYDMRVLEAHPDADDWIQSKLNDLPLEADKALAHLRLYQWLAFAIDMASIQVEYYLENFPQYTNILGMKWDVDALVRYFGK